MSRAWPSAAPVESLQIKPMIPSPGSWLPPPSRPSVGAEEVHVWRIRLVPRPSEREELLMVLSPAERERAGRFRFSCDREEFVSAHGLLRLILGRYTGQLPARLCFSYAPSGKPALASGAGNVWLRFNICHSGKLLLVAVAREREVGIDVEQINASFAFEEFAARFFSLRENAALLALDAKGRRDAFFACWTRKEAFLKAKGCGLGQSLDLFDVSLARGEPAALLAVKNDPAETRRWSLRDLHPGADYAAAVAAEGHGWRLCCWDGESQRRTDESRMPVD